MVVDLSHKQNTHQGVGFDIVKRVKLFKKYHFNSLRIICCDTSLIVSIAIVGELLFVRVTTITDSNSGSIKTIVRMRSKQIHVYQVSCYFDNVSLFLRNIFR